MFLYSIGTFIPASQRPDGTWRRARRVKDGYVPQEEVPLYESKGRQFAQRRANPGLPPGLCPEMVEAARKEREKKEKAKARKEAAATASKQQQIPGVLKLPANTAAAIKQQNPTSVANGQKSKTNTSAMSSSNGSKTNNTIDALSNNLANNLKVEEEPQDLQKKCKKLQKKLREIEEIEKKLKSGALKKPEKDQLDKVARKKAIEKELQQVLAQIEIAEAS